MLMFIVTVVVLTRINIVRWKVNVAYLMRYRFVKTLNNSRTGLNLKTVDP